VSLITAFLGQHIKIIIFRLSDSSKPGLPSGPIRKTQKKLEEDALNITGDS